MTEVAEAVAADLIAEGAEGATEQVVEQTAPEAGAEGALGLPDLPEWEADVDGIEELLDGPEDSIELEDPDVDEPVLVENEYDDPDVAKLKAQLAKTQKQLQYQQELRQKDNQKTWRAEAARRFPLADVDEIEGSSRRSVLRKAKEQHDRYERKLDPVLKSLEELKAIAITEGKLEARREAAEAYGKPVTGPTEAIVQVAEESTRLDRSKYKNPYEMAKARLQGGLQI